MVCLKYIPDDYLFEAFNTQSYDGLLPALDTSRLSASQS